MTSSRTVLKNRKRTTLKLVLSSLNAFRRSSYAVCTRGYAYCIDLAQGFLYRESYDHPPSPTGGGKKNLFLALRS
eukprot:1048779-Rhodomonas_salina.1